MYLFINTASIEKIILALVNRQGNILARKKIKAKYQQSEKLLINIDKLIKSDRNKIKGIIVVSGPGSFTGLRIGVTTANALSFAWNIPVVAVKQSDFGKMTEIGVKKLNQVKTIEYVMPAYGQEPNISKPAINT